MALKRRKCEGKKTSWQRGSMEMDNSWDQDIIATFKNTLILFVCLAKFCTSIAFMFSWDQVSPRRKWKQCFCKILEGQKNSIMVFLKVAYWDFNFISTSCCYS